MRVQYSFFYFHFIKCVPFCILCFFDAIHVGDITVRWASDVLLEKLRLAPSPESYEDVKSQHKTIVSL
jgi:hypothetical protein